MKMAKKVLLVFLTVIVIICLPIGAFAADIPRSVLDAARSVYYIEAIEGQSGSSGTAFIIKTYSDAAFLITNYHVVELNTNNVSVWIGENEKTPAEVLKYSAAYDLALLKISPGDTMRAVVFSDKFERGDSVYALGFPSAADFLSNSAAHLGEDATITDGIISNIRTLQFVPSGPEIQILQINAALNFGNSGGPLVNKNGSVIGINTLGAQGSQGIYGSISVKALEEFLSGTGVELAYTGFSYITAALIAAGVIIIAFAVVFILNLSRKNRGKVRYNFKNGVPLEIYIERYWDKLNPRTIVSLMMPLALELRDRHTRGELSLRLSPNHIEVIKEGCVLTEMCEDDGFLQERFLSPEQIHSEAAGMFSDIYSFCAVLEYMLSNAAHSGNLQADAAALSAIAEKGLAEDPKDRYASMQELINVLMPYNSGISKYLFRQTSPTRQAAKNAAYAPRAVSIEKPDSIYPADADIPIPYVPESVFPADADIPVPSTIGAQPEENAK